MTRYLKAVRNALELTELDVERLARALRHESCCGRGKKSREDKSGATMIGTPFRRHASYAKRLPSERELRSEVDFFARHNRQATPYFAGQRCREAMPVRKMRKHFE